MRTVIVVLIAGLGVLGSRVSVEAHHAFAAAFSEDMPIDLTGTVTRVELINPHTWIWMDVKDKDGTVVNWGIEGGPPNSLFRNGFTRQSLPVGTVIRVKGFQSKGGEKRGVGAYLMYQDGRELFLGGSAPGAQRN
jgi:hypothetical protein